MTRTGYYATVYKALNGKYSADVYYTDGKMFMKSYLYNFKTKRNLLAELAAMRIEVK